MTKSLGPWIAIAGALVGAGLYLGLRERGAQQTAGPHDGSSATRPVVVPAPRDSAAIEKDIAAAFETQRLAWRRACWEPIVAEAPTPATSMHAISVSIAPDGTEILRSINDVRERTRFDVATCLRAQPYQAIRVTPAPGQPTSTTVTLHFP